MSAYPPDDIPDFVTPKPEHLVRSEAITRGVDPDLAVRMMRQESGGRQSAVSNKGARGIMQLMPSTAHQLGVNPNDPYQNIQGGVRYLKQNLMEFGSPQLGAAGYNAGPGNVRRAGGVPRFTETQNYVKNVAPKQTFADDLPDFSSASEAKGSEGIPDFGAPVPVANKTRARASLNLPAQTTAPVGQFDFSKFGSPTGEIHPEAIAQEQAKKAHRITPRSHLMTVPVQQPTSPIQQPIDQGTDEDEVRQFNAMGSQAGMKQEAQRQAGAISPEQYQTEQMQKGQADYLRSLPGGRARRDAAKAIVARGEPLGDEARELAGYSPAESALFTAASPLMSMVGRVISGVSAGDKLPWEQVPGNTSGIPETLQRAGSNLQEAGKNIGQLGYQGPVARFAQGAVSTVPLLALPEGMVPLVTEQYLESRGGGASHLDAIKHAATMAAGLIGGGKLGSVLEEDVQNVVGRYVARSAGLGTGLEASALASGEKPSLEQLGQSYGMGAIFGLQHHSNYQPRAEDGTFVEGKPVVPRRAIQPEVTSGQEGIGATENAVPAGQLVSPEPGVSGVSRAGELPRGRRGASDETAAAIPDFNQVEPQVSVAPEAGRYPVAKDTVDGRRVRSSVPNESSIDATLSGTDYKVLPSVREVSLDEFEQPPDVTKRSKALADEIKHSNEISPLIVAVDKDGPYILEGANRYDALKILGAKSFPAKIVLEEGVDESAIPRQRFTKPLTAEPAKSTTHATYLAGQKYHQKIPEITSLPPNLLKRMDAGEVNQVSPEVARDMKFDEPVEVSVFADGEIRVSDGHHRVAAAKLLGMTAIPVDVQAINAKGETLQELINTSRRLATERGGTPTINEPAPPPSTVSSADIEAALRRRGIHGDRLLDAVDLANDLAEKGGELNSDGTVTAYHRTTPEAAAKITRTGKMTSKEDGLFFGTRPTGQIEGYGDAVVKVRIPLEKLELNDVFGDEAHVRMPTGSIGKKIPVQIEPPSGSPETARPVAEQAGKERALPKTLEEANLPGGTERTYAPISNTESLATANRIIDEKGLDGAVEHMKARREPSATDTATGLALIDRLGKDADKIRGTDPAGAKRREQQAVDVASDLAVNLTKQGQAIQAVQVVNKLSPERALLVASRIAEKNGKELSVEQSKTFRDLASKARDTQTRLDALERQIAEGTASLPKRAKLPSWRASLQAGADEALANLKPYMTGERLGSGAEQIGLLAKYGAYKLADTTLGLAEWTQHMVEKFGNWIEPHLPEIRKQAYGILQDAKKADLLNRGQDRESRPSALKEVGDEVRQAQADQREAERNAERVRKGKLTQAERDQKAEAQQKAKEAQITQAAERKAVADEARQKLTDARAKAAEIEANATAYGRTAEDARARIAEERQKVTDAEAEVRKAQSNQRAQARIEAGVQKRSLAEDYDQVAREARRKAADAKAVESILQGLEAKGQREAAAEAKAARTRAAKWDTPIKNDARVARSKDNLTVDDLTAIAAEKLLKNPRPGTLNREMMAYGDTYSKNREDIFKAAYQKVQDMRSAAKEAQNIRSVTGGQAGAMTDEQIQRLLANRVATRREAMAARFALAQEFARLNNTKLSQLDMVLKANLLASASPYTHKLGSLAANVIGEEAGRIGAAPVDMFRSMLGGKRTVLIDPVGLAKAAFKAGTTGVKEAGQIMKRGYTQRALEQGKAEEHIEVPSGNPIINAANYVFRGFKAGAHVFGTYHYERAMNEQAKLWALTEAKDGVIKRSEVGSRTKEILDGKNMTPESMAAIQENATFAYVDGTFQRDNIPNNILKKIRNDPELAKLTNGGWQFTVNRIIPFMRSPSNALIKTLDFAGVGPKGALSQSIKLVMTKGFESDAQRRDFAQAWGKLPVGLGLMVLGGALHRQGLMTSLIFQKDKNPQPGSVGLGGKLIDVARYSPLGLLMAIGATIDELHQQSQTRQAKGKEGTNWAEEVMGGIGQSISHLPLLDQPARLAEAVKHPSLKGAAASQLAPFVPGYATWRDVYKGNQASLRRANPVIEKAARELGAKPIEQLPPDVGYPGQVLHIRPKLPQRASSASYTGQY